MVKFGTFVAIFFSLSLSDKITENDNDTNLNGSMLNLYVLFEQMYSGYYCW